METPDSFDYIIAGAGCAGLSLLYHILNNPELQSKTVLVLDRDVKNKNDRTWCFWEKNEGPFEKIVVKSWKILQFKTEQYVNTFELKDYTYKMIRGLDFYEFVLEKAAKHKNIHFQQAEIIDFSVESDRAYVRTSQATYNAEYVFNSTGFYNPKLSEENTLLQHFMGWEIQVEDERFDQEVGTLMDFSLDQKPGTSFMYVLPISNRKALVEYTLFTPNTLPHQDYVEQLENYISKDLSIEKYDIRHKEYGVIPMSKAHFPKHYKKRILNIGTAGGHTKASSGYTFQFIQQEIQDIVQALASNNDPVLGKSFRNQMFEWYDKTLLDVMLSEKMDGKVIFTRLFQKIDPETILAFLGNDSNFSDELKIMISLTSFPFITSGIKQLISNK